MATVKVKFRHSIVDGKQGTIYYQLTHRCEYQQITTDIYLFPHQWDASAQRIVDSFENADSLQKRIDNDIVYLERIIKQFKKTREIYTVHDIVRQYRSTQVLTFMQVRIDWLYRNKYWGTARNYRSARNSFSQFLKGQDLPFVAITEDLIEEYNAFLIDRGITRNSISFYMRIMRAVYNKAVRLCLVEQTYPFQNVYTGIDRTCKRAVNENVISSLMRLDVKDSKPLEMTRDMFLFSFYARGMSFVDIAYLRKSDIQNGVICYDRSKTGQRLSIRVEPCMQIIIDRYADKVRHLPYVFPVLKTDNKEMAYKQYIIAINYYNRLLKKLSCMIGLEKKLSSYTSRHSWATVARNRNVPVSVISAGMGHTSEQTTRIYLSMLENTVIDNANREIIASLE